MSARVSAVARWSGGDTSAVLQKGSGLLSNLFGDSLLIGREDPKRGISPDIDLTEAEPLDPKTGKKRRTVHREQAWLERKEQGWRIKVLPGMEKRARLNGRPMAADLEYAFHDGDQLKFGAVELTLRL